MLASIINFLPFNLHKRNVTSLKVTTALSSNDGCVQRAGAGGAGAAAGAQLPRPVLRRPHQDRGQAPPPLLEEDHHRQEEQRAAVLSPGLGLCDLLYFCIFFFVKIKYQ